MYVRWKRRVRAHKPKRVGYWMRDSAPPHVTRAAQLVEMRRVNGQPRQRVVAHLATIDEATMVSFDTRRAFWDVVRDRLDQLRQAGVIDEMQQDEIDATLARTVPHPTQEEWNVYNAERARIRKEQRPITEERARIQELWNAFNKDG
jgi:hypothetical protein